MGVISEIRSICDDIQLTHYLKYNSAFDVDTIETDAHSFYKRLYWKRTDVDMIIPLCKHRERLTLLQSYYSTIADDNLTTSTPWLFYKNKLIPYFRKIEDSGLYTPDGYEHTHYNIYTKTGRPSNSNGGVNYAALNKDDGSRTRFKSRFEGGKLIEFDYDAYHLRLISTLIEYDAPDDSFHTHMAKLYYDKDDITDDEYKQSKSISFTMLYGGIADEYSNVTFFKLIDEYIERLWVSYISNGYIETPIAERRLSGDNFDDMNPRKLFNYLIQAYETEMNVLILTELFDILSPLESKLVLYTYDSFLFDTKKTDIYIKELIKSKLQFPSRCSVGNHYGYMKADN